MLYVLLKDQIALSLYITRFRSSLQIKFYLLQAIFLIGLMNTSAVAQPQQAQYYQYAAGAYEGAAAKYDALGCYPSAAFERSMAQYNRCLASQLVSGASVSCSPPAGQMPRCPAAESGNGGSLPTSNTDDASTSPATSTGGGGLGQPFLDASKTANTPTVANAYAAAGLQASMLDLAMKSDPSKLSFGIRGGFGVNARLGGPYSGWEQGGFGPCGAFRAVYMAGKSFGIGGEMGISTRNSVTEGDSSSYVNRIWVERKRSMEQDLTWMDFPLFFLFGSRTMGLRVGVMFDIPIGGHLTYKLDDKTVADSSFADGDINSNITPFFGIGLGGDNLGVEVRWYYGLQQTLVLQKGNDGGMDFSLLWMF